MIFLLVYLFNDNRGYHKSYEILHSFSVRLQKSILILTFPLCKTVLYNYLSLVYGLIRLIRDVSKWTIKQYIILKGRY